MTMTISPAKLAARAPARKVAKQVDRVNEAITGALSTEILSAVPDVFMVLNKERQVVFANDALFEMLGLDKGHCVMGQRPGELLGCLNADAAPGGCGCAAQCSACGAVRAILSAQAGERCVEECRLTLASQDALDLRVWASPLRVGNDSYTIFGVTDISHEKRRRVLERLFFHDILNLAGNLLGYSCLLEDASDLELAQCRKRLRGLSEQLIDELKAHRELAAAENGELTVHVDPVVLGDLLAGVQGAYMGHSSAIGREIMISPDSWQGAIQTDCGLLSRVLGNMVKNALEATPQGSRVEVGAEQTGGKLRIWVRNPGVMPRQVQLQVFQRSFSTKGESRGLGTYSMRLLGERYLGGKLGFSSDETNQTTTFWVELPGGSSAAEDQREVVG